ncbi:MAG TPA: M20/M25/M40 family metallo-hydrolase [Polyangiaceae bacterium]
MPDSSYSGELPASTPALQELSDRLREHVLRLEAIGTRHLRRAGSLAAARGYLAERLSPLEMAPGTVQYEDVAADVGHAQNLIFEVSGGQHANIVVVGAHYDTTDAGPGANDNGSGVAVTLELAKRLAQTPAPGRVRFVFFVNEEAPYFKTAAMGSKVHADHSRQRGDSIVAMLSLETIGYYSREPDSQHYPFPIGLFYPSRGNFLGFVGDLAARPLVRAAIGAFRRAEPFPSEGAALPATFPGIDWSDHWSFRRVGYPAIMLTDTALYRDPHYHQPSDTHEHLDYRALAQVTRGIEAVVRELAK